MHTIDLNGDVGEGFDDLAMLPYLTSLNVACGGHAGDAVSILNTVAAGATRGLAIGAHPSYPDRAGFGRRELDLPPAELERALGEQLSLLAAIARDLGVRLTHVKPHGALYNRAARDPAVARVVARTVAACDPGLTLISLPGSALLVAGREVGLPIAAEGFADRRYCGDGSLAPRGTPGAVLADPHSAAAQAVALARGLPIATTDGVPITLAVATICLHSDSPDAAAIAPAVRRALADAGFELRALAPSR